MNTIKLERNKGFEIKIEPNFLDERKIQQESANILGGWDKFAELENAITNAYQQHLEHNKKILGNEFEIKYKRYLELIRDGIETEELETLRKELNNNKYYKTYVSLVQEKQLVTNYATLLVLSVKTPDDFDFEKCKEEQILDIYFEYEELKKKMMSELKNL